MPIGIKRINAKKSQPNERIIFIKPLKGPDEAIAQDFLGRIAAQCVPIMKENHLSVMSLEQYEWNPEFVGRNFNAGEVIQLVLKARSGRWLPFGYVQMVMMHELAHCKQMNHSKAFWAVRNSYAERMEALWSHGYTGEGIWGRGALLTTGRFEHDVVMPDENFTEHLCGGAYRSRRRKRKATMLSYKEQKERRILKKFGANGVALGDNESTKRKLENGRTITAKPRVASSKRGRELRAAAALARFDQVKKEEKTKPSLKTEDKDETASEADSESGEEYDVDLVDSGVADALDINGTRLIDGEGNGMINVCEDENPEDEDAQRELRELQSSMKNLRTLDNWIKKEPSDSQPPGARSPKSDSLSDQKLAPTPASERPSNKSSSTEQSLRSKPEKPAAVPEELRSKPENPRPTETEDTPDTLPQPQSVCSICSFDNGPLSITCSMCANVLDANNVPGTWECTSQACKDSKYLNAGDCGVCGVCGQRRAAAD